tara:strand:+ start:5599 stop:6675 length:1077 start_codon:yes stop_codon:yes gene_type:complete
MKKAIILINGLGLGNSTRCKVLIDWLFSKNYEVTILTSGNGEEFFNKKKYNIIKLDRIDYGKISERLSILKLFVNLVKIFRIVKKNSIKINNLVKKIDADLIISDSVYFFPNKDFKKRYSIALNNSNLVIKYFFKLKYKPLSIFPQFFFIEVFDYIISKSVYKKIWSPVISMTDFKNFNDLNNKIITLPPISRFKNKNIHKDYSKNIKKICIMLSGSSFKTKIELSENNLKNFHFNLINYNYKLGSKKYDNHKYYYKEFDNYKLLKECDIAIINSGYSAISDCINLELPMILIPVKNHAEQYINSKIIEQEKFGIMSSDDLNKDIIKISKNYNIFKNNLIENNKKITGINYFVNELLK